MSNGDSIVINISNGDGECLISDVAGIVSGANGNDVGVVAWCITNVVWIFEIRSRLEDESAIGIDGEFVVVVIANESPIGDGFVSREGMNRGDIFSNGCVGGWITWVAGRTSD